MYFLGDMSATMLRKPMVYFKLFFSNFFETKWGAEETVSKPKKHIKKVTTRAII